MAAVTAAEPAAARGELLASAGGDKDVEKAPASAPPSLSLLLANPLRPGAGPAGGRMPGKAQLLKEIQRSYGNAYAQKVVQMLRAGGGAGKQGKGGGDKSAGGGKAAGKSAPSPDKMAALLGDSEKAASTGRGDRGGGGAGGKGGTREDPKRGAKPAAPARAGGGGGGGANRDDAARGAGGGASDTAGGSGGEATTSGAPARAPAKRGGPGKSPAVAKGAAGKAGPGPTPPTGGAAGGGAAPAAAVGGKLAADEVDLSTGELVIPEAIAAGVTNGGDVDLKVRLPGLAEGTLRVHKRGETFDTVGVAQGILLSHPALARFAASTPTVLALNVKENKVSGWVGIGAPGPAKGGARSLLDTMAKGAELLGWAGLSHITFPTVRNQFADGVLDVGVENLTFSVGGFLSGTGAMAIDNKALSFDGSAKVEIPGGSGGELLIKKDPAGALSGKLDIAVKIGSVTGTVTATLASGFVAVMGSVAYSGDKLSGKLTLVATDEATARDITLKKPEGGDVPIELPGPDTPVKPGKRAFCGWGQLTFQVTDWLAGTATVIVNSQGQATIVGEIAPPKEFILFEQKEWTKKLFKVEIRAGYGIPVVGQVALFANIGLDAIAKVGPGKLYNIKLAGAYSTDPRVPKQLSIEGTLNISAFAGLRLRAEAGVVLTIIGHDIKAGVGLNAIAGVRGYVEATPRIGMREKAPGKPEYYIQGHMEIAAQPVLGFGGDLFVEIETPWWSPLSDKRWTWPLFSIEYPLPGEFGIGADVDYILGSKQWPKIEFGEVDFDSSKFLTDVMNDNTDKGSGAEAKKPGDWKEGEGGGGPGGAKNKGGSGKKPGEMGADNEPVGQSLSFSDGKESHRLWFAEKSGDATLMVASDEKKLPASLKERRGKVKNLLKADRPKAEGLIKKAEDLLPNVTEEGKQVAAMKQAEANAKKTYEEQGKKKGKKGKKDSRKDKNKKLKADQKNVEAVLAEQFALTRMDPWKQIDRPAKWQNKLRGLPVTGQAMVSIVGGGEKARLNLDQMPWTEAIKNLEAGPIAKAKNPAGHHVIVTAGRKLKKESDAIGEVPIANNENQARAKPVLEKLADRIVPVVTELGHELKLQANLSPAMKPAQPQPMSPAWPILFKVRSTKAIKYQETFEPELTRQLEEWRKGFSALTVDQWVANFDTFRAKSYKDLKALDKNARAAVAKELRARLESATTATDAEVTLLAVARANLRDFIDRNNLQKLDLTDPAALMGSAYYKKLSKSAQKRLRYIWVLNKKVNEAEKIEPARKAVGKTLVKDSDLSKQTPSQLGKVSKLLGVGKLSGRSDHEVIFRRLHEEGLKEAMLLLSSEGKWKGLREKGNKSYSVLHNPDQVNGGYGEISPLEPIGAMKKPEKPKAPTEAENEKYDEDMKKWDLYVEKLKSFVGPSRVNSVLAGNADKIPEVKPAITAKPNYHPPVYGLWKMNFKIDHVYKT